MSQQYGHFTNVWFPFNVPHLYFINLEIILAEKYRVFDTKQYPPIALIKKEYIFQSLSWKRKNNKDDYG